MKDWMWSTVFMVLFVVSLVIAIVFALAGNPQFYATVAGAVSLIFALCNKIAELQERIEALEHNKK